MGPQRTSLRAVPRAVRGASRPWGLLLPWLWAASLLPALLTPGVAFAEKTDVVVLGNGDHITGEVKGMAQGKLDYKTDDAGRLSIEWVKVTRISSKHVFELETQSGKKYYGTLQSPADYKVQVGSDGADTLEVSDVINITPMDEFFWARFKANLDFGFTLTKASSSMTLSSDGDFAYRGEHFGGGLDFNAYWQRDSNSTAVGQFNVNHTGTYFFTKWKAQLLLGFWHNDELDLHLRIDVGGGAGYPVVRNNWNELWLSAGLLVDFEQYNGVEPNNNLAAFFAGDWEAFIYDSPKLSAGVNLQIIPVLTELWRTRGTLTVKLKYEVFHNFFIGTNFSYTFDTEPPEPTAAKTDYLFSLTVGWSYRE